MTSLKKISGLPLFLKKDGVIFGGKMHAPSFQSKDFNQYKKFFQPSRLDKNKHLYYIYRNSCLENDLPVFLNNGLSYDITLLFPGRLGNEPMRTIGHIHKPIRGSRPSEIYQVLSGKALFLLHDIKSDTIYRIYRNSGQKIVIPGNCAHITINASLNKPLLLANIFSNAKNASDYRFFKKTNGPSWYPVIKKNKIFFSKNILGGKSTMIAPISKKISMPKGVKNNFPLYREFVNNPDKFTFLKHSNKISDFIR